MCNKNGGEQVVKHGQRQQQPQHQQQQPQQQQQQWEPYQAPENEDKLDMEKRLRVFRRRISQEELEQLRRKSEYTFPQVTDAEKIHHAEAKEHHVIKNLNGAIVSVMGEQIYEQIDAIQTSEEEKDRTVRLHHARGTQLTDSGKQVFKYRFAGTSFRQWREDQNGSRGKEHFLTQEEYEDLAKKIFKRMTKLADMMDSSDMTEWTKKQREEYQAIRQELDQLREQMDMQEEYGELVQFGDKTKKYVLKKTSQDGKKVAYSIAGALNKLAVNYGDYSIESNIESFLELAKGDLEPIFKKWEEDGQAGEDIYMLIRGHSRGGVASLIGPMKLQKWLNDTWPQYADKIKFEITQHDPVAGLTSNWKEKDRLDIRGNEKELAKRGMAPLKNAETTVIYSMHTDHSLAFRPQDVRGAKRVILTPFRHSTGLEMVDESQVRIRKDSNGKEVERKEKAHRTGYTDLKTGEVYRQTGLNELDTGFYILDQNNNLVKLDSYEQAEKIIELALKGTHLQWRRHAHIRAIAQEWFNENRSVDEISKQAQNEESERTQFLEKLLGDEKKSIFLDGRDSPQMVDVKTATNELLDALAQPVDSDEAVMQCKGISECYQKVIRTCKIYNKRFAFTPVGRARKRMVEQLQQRAEAEQKYFADYENRISPFVEMHMDDEISWNQILTSVRSVRMDKLSEKEGASLTKLKNGESDTLVRGNKLYQFRRENDPLAQSSSARKNVAARDLSELLGVSGLYEQAHFAEVHVKAEGKVPAHTVRGVLTRESGSEPLTDVMQRAEQQHIKLSYTPQAFQQMQLIRMMDVLTGHFTRGEQDFQVTVKEEKLRGVGVRWKITQVRSKNNENAFAEKSLAEQYQGKLTLGKLFGNDKLSDEQKVLLGQLDALSDELIDFRLGHALTPKELGQLKQRIHEVQRLYRSAVKKGLSF